MREQQCDYVLKTASERGVRMVRLWFTDVLGNLKSFAISQNELENALNDGMTFDGSSIDGFSRVQESDVLAIPDPDTFQILPFGDKDAAEARVFCDIHPLMALRSLATHAKCCDAMLKQRAVRASRFTLRLTSSSSTSHLRNLASDQPLSISGATLTSPPEMSLATSASKRFAPSNKSGSRSSTHSMKILRANRKSIFVTTMLSPLPTR